MCCEWTWSLYATGTMWEKGGHVVCACGVCMWWGEVPRCGEEGKGGGRRRSQSSPGFVEPLEWRGLPTHPFLCDVHPLLGLWVLFSPSLLCLRTLVRWHSGVLVCCVGQSGRSCVPCEQADGSCRSARGGGVPARGHPAGRPCPSQYRVRPPGGGAWGWLAYVLVPTAAVGVGRVLLLLLCSPATLLCFRPVLTALLSPRSPLTKRYMSLPLPGVPFDHRRHVIRHEAGRVVDEAGVAGV
jgi:hypothetical protein